LIFKFEKLRLLLRFRRIIIDSINLSTPRTGSEFVKMGSVVCISRKIEVFDPETYENTKANSSGWRNVTSKESR
jgi:hypothetical protein